MRWSCLFIATVVLSVKISALSGGNSVNTWLKRKIGYPEELGDFFEGDIDIPNRKKAGLRQETKKWPNGRIPFEIIGKFTPNEYNMIYKAMHTISQYTCIRFISKTACNKDYVRITNKQDGCHSSVGKLGGVQNLNLQSPICFILFGTVIHELLHTVGFYHEQSRTDRDKYVKIIWENIRKGKESNFQKYDQRVISHYGVNYDYNSVMHYSAYAFSKNAKPTIFAKSSKRDVVLGQNHSLAESDIRKVNTMYNCVKY